MYSDQITSFDFSFFSSSVPYQTRFKNKIKQNPRIFRRKIKINLQGVGRKIFKRTVKTIELSTHQHLAELLSVKK